jgi:hypothetical protein
MRTRKPATDVNPARVAQAVQAAHEAAVDSIDAVAKEPAAEPPRPGYDPKRGFPSAQPGGKAELGPAMRRIVETVFLRGDEMEAAAERLIGELRIGEGRGDHGTVIRRLDEAEDNARLAHQLLISAKLEQDRYNLENEANLGAMRAEARAHLEAEKVAEKRTKLITDADVLAKCATLFEDEWPRLQHEARKLELAVRHLDHQVANWASRCKSLQVMAGKLR